MHSLRFSKREKKRNGRRGATKKRIRELKETYEENRERSRSTVGYKSSTCGHWVSLGRRKRGKLQTSNLLRRRGHPNSDHVGGTTW